MNAVDILSFSGHFNSQSQAPTPIDPNKPVLNVKFRSMSIYYYNNFPSKYIDKIMGYIAKYWPVEETNIL